MILLTGPGGSGKTEAVLGRVRERLRSGRTKFLLLVPTATMAEHIRNLLAREGFVFSPGLVRTFTKFVGGEGAPPTGALEMAVRAVLQEDPGPFRAVAEFRGFERAVAGLVLDCSSAGWVWESVRPAWRPVLLGFADIYRRVEGVLEGRGWRLRGASLRAAAERIAAEGVGGAEEIFLDGFFQFTEPEVAVLGAMARWAEMTVTLPTWVGAEYARRELRRMGFEERPVGPGRRTPAVRVWAAGSLAAETEAVAARIVELARAGRRFRDIGIVVRGDNAYVPALRTSLERFGIPATFLFGEPLRAHPVIRYVAGVMGALRKGWDWEELLEAMAAAPSGLGGTRAGDAFEFQIREKMPGRGLQEVPEEWRAKLEWVAETFDGEQPAKEWAARCQQLRRLVTLPERLEDSTQATALLWRGIPAALAGFESAAAETAKALGEERVVRFGEFWTQLEEVLEGETLRVQDRRRDTVHVMDVYEARQWALPVVFVCGLLEKEFPRHHQQDAVLPDADRVELQRAGIRLRTSGDLQREENSLFDLAVTRASEELVLSYPRFNSKGDENLRSFVLDRFVEERGIAVEEVRGARPAAGRRRETGARVPAVDDPALRERLARRHARLGPTAIESYLQCGFQFFASKSLQLKDAPPRPEERMDVPAQGNVLHGVLAEWVRTGGDWRGIFDRTWADTCRRLRVVEGYKTESIRLELVRNLEMLVPALGTLPMGANRVEQEFALALSEEFGIRGTVDRLIVSEGAALVLDYKYSGPERIGKLVAAHEEGLLVQGGLYLIAAEERMGLRPVGFLYAGSKKELKLGGWHTVAGIEKPEACAPERLREVMEQARAGALAVYERICGGRIAPRPADKEKCGRCDFADICRRETVPAVEVVEQ